MRVLGIDPGYERVGVAILERVNGKESVLFSSCFQTPKQSELPQRLDMVGAHLRELIREWEPDALALETLFFNTNHKTVMAVAQMRGVALFVATQAGLRTFEYTPPQVKVAVSGYGKSDKKHVASMVERLVELPPRKRLDDEYDAIAVCLTCLATERTR